MGKLNGKVAIITGGSSDIGLETAKRSPADDPASSHSPSSSRPVEVARIRAGIG